MAHTPKELFRLTKGCGCQLSIFGNIEGQAVADFSLLGDQTPGVEWATCSTHAAAPQLLEALERLEGLLNRSFSGFGQRYILNVGETNVARHNAREVIELAKEQS